MSVVIEVRGNTANSIPWVDDSWPSPVLRATLWPTMSVRELAHLPLDAPQLDLTQAPHEPYRASERETVSVFISRRRNLGEKAADGLADRRQSFDLLPLHRSRLGVQETVLRSRMCVLITPPAVCRLSGARNTARPAR